MFKIFLISILGLTLNLISSTKAEAIIYGVKSQFINNSSQANNSYPGAAPANLFSFIAFLRLMRYSNSSE